MELIKYPPIERWPSILARPSEGNTDIWETVRNVVDDVRDNGDAAIRKYSNKFDRVDVTELAVSSDEIEFASSRVPQALKDAIRLAKRNIEAFHAAQAEPSTSIETAPGVLCWRRAVPIEKVGIYVPGGGASLFSTVLMLAIPAQLAGCSEIIMCTPPDGDGRINDAVLFTAQACGVTKIFKIGGAQAIAALAHGTATVPRVFKIFGPGNRYVTVAKQMLSHITPIDMPAGPSEVAVLADDTGVPEFIASDLLSQAEHGADSQVVLVSPDLKLIENVLSEVETQVEDLPRKEIARASLKNSIAILVPDLDTGLALVNFYAPEHLILAVRDLDAVANKVVNAGSVFLGNFSCESAGDYASGTNHTLPTGGFAKSFSGVSLDSFVKKITYQKLTAEGIKNIGPSIELMAEAERLQAHKNAISLRLSAIAAGEVTGK